MSRIVIADDHAVVRTGIQLILEDIDELDLIGECETGDELIEFIKKEGVDLVLLDIRMPGSDTIQILQYIKKEHPGLPVIIFTMSDDKYHMVKMLQSGASAFLSKQSSPTEIVEVIRHVLSKKRYITSGQAAELADLLIDNPVDDRGPNSLTPREFQILTLIASGIDYKEIAFKLNLSKNTIGNHRSHILKKLGLKNNSDITRYAYQNGLIK
jgi:two-component system invasion response regulator UvrY